METNDLDTVVVRVRNLCIDLETQEVEAVIFLCDLKNHNVVPTFYGTTQASQFARGSITQKAFLTEFLRFCEEIHSRRKRNELISAAQAEPEEDMTLDMSVEEATNEDDKNWQQEQIASDPFEVADKEPQTGARGGKHLWEHNFNQFVQMMDNDTDKKDDNNSGKKSLQIDTNYKKNLMDSEKTSVSSHNVTVKREVTFEDSEQYGKLPGYSEDVSIDQNLVAEIKTEPIDPDDVSLINNEYEASHNILTGKTNVRNSLSSSSVSVSMAANQQGLEHEKSAGVKTRYAASTSGNVRATCGSTIPAANVATVSPVGAIRTTVAGATNSQNVLLIVPFSATITPKKSAVPPNSSSSIPTSSVPSIPAQISLIPTNRGPVLSTQISTSNKSANPMYAHSQKTVVKTNLQSMLKRRNVTTSSDCVTPLLKQQKVAQGDSSTKYSSLLKVNSCSEIMVQKPRSSTNTSEPGGRILRASKRIHDKKINCSTTTATEFAKGSNSTSQKQNAKQVSRKDHQNVLKGQASTSLADDDGDDIKEEDDRVDDEKLGIPTGESNTAGKDPLLDTVSLFQFNNEENCTYDLEVKKEFPYENEEKDKNCRPERKRDFNRKEIDRKYVGNIDSSSDGNKTDKDCIPDSSPDVQESDEDCIPESGCSSYKVGIDEDYSSNNESVSGNHNIRGSECSSKRKRKKNSSARFTKRVVLRNKTDSMASSRNNKSKSIYVARCTKKPDGKRIWDKKHICFYCLKEYAKLTRHLQQKHSKEVEVQTALTFKKNSKKRKEAWRRLMCKGDYAHNIKVVEKGSGEIIPCKRPPTETEGTSYIQCKHCLGTYLSSELGRHMKKVHPENKQVTQSRDHRQVVSVSLIPVTDAASRNFREKILDKLLNDSVSLIAQSDSDIVIFGQQKYLKSARNEDHFGHIRQKMRDLARFVQSAREVDSSIKTLRDCITPTKFESCARAVKNLCCFDETTEQYGFPSLAKYLGHSLLQVAMKIKTDAMAKGDRILRRKAECFIKLFKSKWEVHHKALEPVKVKDPNKPVILPLAEDLKVLSSCLKKRAQEILNSSEITQVDYRDLSQVTLTQLVLFNKTRAEETQRLMVQQYLDRIQNSNTIQSEVLESLSPLERKLAEVVNRVEVRGIKGKRVAILIPQNLKKQMDILIQNRFKCGILRFNLYMFPGEAATPLRAHNVLRDFANTCRAKEPDTLTNTEFQKHVATMTQVIHLKNNGLDILATFLGQDVNTYKDLYQLPEDTVQVAKVSKLLLEMEKGNFHLYAGKSIDEIPLDEEDHSKLEEPEPSYGIKQWSNTAGRTLIDLHTKLYNMSVKKKKVWQSISREMVAKNFNFSATQCEQKWKNMTKAFRDCINHNSKPGNIRKECPFYAELQEWYGYKPNERPDGTGKIDPKEKNSVSLDMLDAASESSSSSTCTCDSFDDL